jgi:hypothetical protein
VKPKYFPKKHDWGPLYRDSFFNLDFDRLVMNQQAGALRSCAMDTDSDDELIELLSCHRPVSWQQ